MIKNFVKAVIRRVNPTDKGRVKRLMNNPPRVQDNHIVFTSSEDYTGNPKALFLYMIDHGYNERYKMTWLFEYKENEFNFNMPNVKTAVIRNKKGERTPAAQKAIMSAKYIFYSHNVNWARTFRPEQLFIDLGHGCGYKDTMSSDKRQIYFDYTISVGKKHIDILRRFLKSPEGKVLDFGLPRNEFFYSNRSKATTVMIQWLNNSEATKAVIWMPTFRKSNVKRLDNDTEMGHTGLPILYDNNDLYSFNEVCKRNQVLVVLKKHVLQSDYTVEKTKYSNIIIVDDKDLKRVDADLYELLAVSDALLTDYSSVAIDYMLLNRPIGFTFDDFKEYENKRGWAMENVKEYMPGHHIYNMYELQQFIEEIANGKDPYIEWRERVTKELHTYNDGFSKRILDYFNI